MVSTRFEIGCVFDTDIKVTLYFMHKEDGHKFFIIKY
jgi:hypothetical protein